MSPTAAELVADARTRIREPTPGTFHARSHPGVLIDVREPAEFETGPIAGAIDLPRGALEFQVDRPLVVYCRTGGRAALAADSLRRMGFTNVHSIAGSISDWTAAGPPPTMR